MAEKKLYSQNSQGRFEHVGYAADKSDDEIADTLAAGRMGTTAGADLGGKARAAAAAKPAKEETDPSKMSPLARAAYENKRRKSGSATTDDAAGALSRRMSGGY